MKHLLPVFALVLLWVNHAHSQSACSFDMKISYRLGGGDKPPENWTSLQSNVNTRLPFIVYSYYVKDYYGLGETGSEVRYKMEVENLSNFDLYLNFQWSNTGGGGLTIKAGGTETIEKHYEDAANTAFVTVNEVKLRFNRQQQEEFGVSQHRISRCGEDINSLLNELRTKNTSQNQTTSSSDSGTGQNSVAQSTRNSSSEWNEEESLLDDDSKNFIKNGNKAPKETIYQKREREAAEKAQRERLEREKSAREQEAYLNRVKQNGNQKLKAIDNIESSWNAVYDAYSEQQRQETARKSAERDAYYRQKAEERRLERLEDERRAREYEAKRKREQAEREEKERIYNARQRFYASLKDHKMPFVVNEQQLYFFMVTRPSSGYGVQFAPFSLYKNSSNQLPYKTTVVEDFKTKVKPDYSPVLYGPFKTLMEQQQVISDMKTRASNAEIKILPNISYQFEQKLDNNLETDFWGNKKKKQSDKKTDSFWK